MDVGNPSNFTRIKTLYSSNRDKIAEDILSISVRDETTAESITTILDKYNYLVDPHTAVGIKGLENFCNNNQTGIVLSTAHPGKFADVIEPIINDKVILPEQLENLLTMKKQSILISNDYDQFESVLLD